MWSNSMESVRNISIAQLEMLLSGLSVDPPRGFGEITARDFLNRSRRKSSKISDKTPYEKVAAPKKHDIM